MKPRKPIKFYTIGFKFDGGWELSRTRFSNIKVARDRKMRGERVFRVVEVVKKVVK